MNPIKATVQLDTADDNGICESQTAPASGWLTVNGALATGDVANNIATAQSAAGAADLTLNGSTVSSGVAYLGNGACVQIVSAADDSGITFTVYGQIAGVSSPFFAAETITGSATSTVATSNTFISVSRVATSAATAGNVTVGTCGVATLTDAGAARQVILTSGGDDTGVTFTLYGTDANGNALTEAVTGANTAAASSTKYFHTMTRVATSAATTGTIIVGTNGVGATRWIALSTQMTPANTACAVTVADTVNYTVQYIYDAIGLPGAPTWYDPYYEDITTIWDDTVLASETTNGQTTFSFPITAVRCKVNSGTGTATMLTVQAGISGNL